MHLLRSCHRTRLISFKVKATVLSGDLSPGLPHSEKIYKSSKVCQDLRPLTTATDPCRRYGTQTHAIYLPRPWTVSDLGNANARSGRSYCAGIGYREEEIIPHVMRAQH